MTDFQVGDIIKTRGYNYGSTYKVTAVHERINTIDMIGIQSKNVYTQRDMDIFELVRRGDAPVLIPKVALLKESKERLEDLKAQVSDLEVVVQWLENEVSNES